MRKNIILLLSISCFLFCSCKSVEKTPSAKKQHIETTQEVNVDLFKTQWNLISIGSQRVKLVEPENKITMTLSEEAKRVAGHSGCNRYFGGFEFKKGIFTFGEFGSTMMACPENDMNIEQNFLRTLKNVTNYTIEGKVLYFKKDERVLLTFEAE